MIFKLTAILIILLNSFMYPISKPEIQANIESVQNVSVADQAYLEQTAELLCLSNNAEGSMLLIEILWERGIDDPRFDLLACCNYRALGE